MKSNQLDLNLLRYLDVLLKEQNVTRSASLLGITQPAMSNGLRRLREMFNDPLLIRTSEGMIPTERAQSLRPLLRETLLSVDQLIEPSNLFDPQTSTRVFRIMTSDYAEVALLPRLLKHLQKRAPNIILDILTPNDIHFSEVEKGQIDLVINRFDNMPQTFHQKILWDDTFSCVFAVDNPLSHDYRLETYLKAKHIWVSKTASEVGIGITPYDTRRLSWVDDALLKIGHKRQISVYTNHYQSAAHLAEGKGLIATIPSRTADMLLDNPRILIKKPPFEIPKFELKMIWSPLLQHNVAHQWLRNMITKISST